MVSEVWSQVGKYQWLATSKNGIIVTVWKNPYSFVFPPDFPSEPWLWTYDNQELNGADSEWEAKEQALNKLTQTPV